MERREEALWRLALPTQFPGAVMKAAGAVFDLNCMWAADTVLFNTHTRARALFLIFPFPLATGDQALIP